MTRARICGHYTCCPVLTPAVDNVCEYTDKVKFLHAICPDKDRPMLAPRLAMVCKVQRGGKSET